MTERDLPLAAVPDAGDPQEGAERELGWVIEHNEPWIAPAAHQETSEPTMEENVNEDVPRVGNDRDRVTGDPSEISEVSRDRRRRLVGLVSHRLSTDTIHIKGRDEPLARDQALRIANDILAILDIPVGAPARAAEWQPLTDLLSKWNHRIDLLREVIRLNVENGPRCLNGSPARFAADISYEMAAVQTCADELEKLLPPGALAGDSNSKR